MPPGTLAGAVIVMVFAAFVAGVFIGQWHTYRTLDVMELRSTQRLVWIKDWLRRQEHLALFRGDRTAADVFAAIREGGFDDVTDTTPS